jgi:ferric-dicitrate binding protein FerR (iron transport regulator)
MGNHESLGPPPVEPLSDIAWSRVERGLWSRMDGTQVTEPAARPRRWIWIAAPALAAAMIAISVGTGGDRAPDEGSARLVSGAAPTTLSYGDVHVTLDADSAAVMDHQEGVTLERGAAWFAVAPRGERPPFVVTAGDTVVRVVGTRFRVARFGEEATVQVEHGVVDVLFRGATARVRADEQWTSRQPMRVTAVRMAKATPAARLAADRREPRAKNLLEIYLTRFLAGANADDARELLDHLQEAHR